MVVRRANALTKTGVRKSGRRKRSSVVTRAKLQKPTAKNQRSQIISNAANITKMAKIVYNNRVWCDWQYTEAMYGLDMPSTGAYTTKWSTWDLMNFPAWNPVLRQSPQIEDSVKTYIDRIQLNMRYALQAADWAQVTLFVVSIRPQSTVLDPVGVPPAITSGYILNGANDFNPRLNPAIYKVHYSRNVTLTKDGLFDIGAIPTVPAGNPNTTWAKGQLTIPVKSSVRSPYQILGQQKWKLMTGQQLPYYQRRYIMAYICQRSPINTPTAGGLRISFDALATTINSD